MRTKINQKGVLKALLKYSLSLFILLLIAYSQLFSPLFRGGVSLAPVRKITSSAQSKSLDVKTTDLQTIFIAEEEESDDDRISFKKQLAYSPVLTLTLLHEWVLPLIKNHLSLGGNFSCLSLQLPPYLLFRVFRL